MGWREDLRNRLNPRRPAGFASQPACPECAAQRTVQTIDRTLYCPTCGHGWTADVHAWRAFVPMVDSPPPPRCPNCGKSMTYEHVVRQRGSTAGGDVAAGWMHPGCYRRAHCFHCDHVLEPPTRYDEH